MSLNDIKTEFKDEISSMVDDLNNSLPMSKPQLRQAFSDDELKKLHALIKEVNEATSDNNKVTKLKDHAQAVLGLLRKLGVGI